MKNIFVIIPVYNCEKYIENAVDSVLGQSYKNIHIILINDGSTDNSAQICDILSSQNERIYVIHQKNQGVSVARNNGIQYVSSIENDDYYIAFLDADDVWIKNFFDQIIIDLLDKNYDLIGFQSCKCNHELQYRENPSDLNNGEYVGCVENIWLHGKQHFAAMFYRGGFLKQYGLLFSPIKYSEDKIFSLACMYLAESLYCENRLLYIQRQNKYSVMHKRPYGIEYYEPLINAYLFLDEQLKKWKNEARGEFCVGHSLARNYILDMIEEHIRTFKSAKEIERYLLAKPNYVELLKQSYGGDYLNNRYLAMKNNKIKFIIKNRLLGCKNKLKNIIAHISILRDYIEKKQYSVRIESDK